MRKGIWVFMFYLVVLLFMIILFWFTVFSFSFIIHDRLICCTEVLLLENDSRLVINLFKFGRWEGEQLAPLYPNCSIGT